MKKLCIFSCVYLLFMGMLNAQTRGINYKAMITDATGTPLDSEAVTIQLTVLEGNTTMTEVYKETHTATTDTNGIVIINIGEGTIISGNFSTINWGTDTHFLKTEIDIGNGYVDFGTTEFKTVPYALYAESAGVSSPFSESANNRITAANTNANFVVGSTSTEDQDNVNLDSRLFFDKSRVAFRAGAVNSSQWDNANRGLYSFAGGRNNTASGIASTAFGENNEVSGYGAMVLGQQNTANGSNSLVAGFGNISSSAINAQTVLGKWNEVDTNAVFIIGNGADNLTRKNILSVQADGNIIANDLTLAEITDMNALVTKAYVDANVGTPSTGLQQLDEGNGIGWRLLGRDATFYGNIGLGAVDISTNTIASTSRGATGNYSLATGFFTIASGAYSHSGGNGSIAHGDYSFVHGSANTATGTHGVAFGEISNARGNYSFATGLNAEASGIAAIALGNNVEASGDYSFAAGQNSDATQNHATAFGINSIAQGNASFAAGYFAAANGPSSVSIGNGSTANGPASTAVGQYTITSNVGAFAAGSYNEDDNLAKFMIGNGTSTNRNTAFKVMESGIVNIDNLAGTGTRNVRVDANGNLLATASVEEDILVITPFDFSIDSSGIPLAQAPLNGAYVRTPGDVSTIYAPVQFPKNARITKVEYVYKDTSLATNEALEFKIGFQQFDNSTNSLQQFFVSGTNLNTNSYASTNRVATASNVNFPVTSLNTNIFRAYFVSVAPVSGGQWSGTADTAILQVRIHYTQ